MRFLKDLNPDQIDAVRSVNGPVIIIAGAGSGKTRVLTYRIAYLLESGVPPSEILALTFTNKAAGEMKKRVANLVGKEASGLWMGTFHSIFARILRKECNHLNYKQNFTIYDEDDSINTIKRVLEKLNLSIQQYNPHAIKACISRSKNRCYTPEKYTETVRSLFEEKVAVVYAEYQKTLEHNNAMDFDDLLMKPIELFHRKKNILEKYQYKFKFILVDEFQDTNRAQYNIIRLLSQVHNNITVVGDDSQSIYSFRGAEIQNILDFQKDYLNCQVFRLEQNYRSTKAIISVADNLIKHNKQRLEKNLWTANPVGEPVTVVKCSDDTDEGSFIIRTIQREIARKHLDLKDFAVLYRTNAQSRTLEEAFIKNAIPYEIVGGIRFYERKEIKDILAYLRVIVNSDDTESLLRIINYPSRGVGDVTITHLINYAKQKLIPIFLALNFVDEMSGIAERTKLNLKQFKGLIDKYQRLKTDLGPNELVRSLIDELGILRSFKEEGTPEAIGRWENIQEFISAVSEFCQNNPYAKLEEFLEEISLVSDIDKWNEQRNAVTLMTIHSAKGLEFPVVFITGLEEGLLPFYSNIMDNNDIEEERRVFYVGMTRAKQKLYLTHVCMRYRYGDITYPSESRFLYEIGEDNVERLESLNGHHHKGRKIINGGNKALTRDKNYDRTDEEILPNYESESQEYFEIKQGAIVHHDVFGRGKVIEVNGKGEYQKAVVKFDSCGTKNLILKYARLRAG